MTALLEFPPVRFRVTPAMMARYPRVFGDFSSLHTDADFARTTPYGRIIAWGAQPLFFLACLEWRRAAAGQARIERLSASFTQPVLVDESVELRATLLPPETPGGAHELEFDVRRASGGTVLTIGSAAVRMEQTPAPFDEIDGEESMPLASLVEQMFEFGDIERGQASGFEFVFRPAAALALAEMLADGIGDNTVTGAQIYPLFDPRPVLLAPFFTTMMGMLMPGRRATCANLDFAIARPPAWGERCVAEGRVAFKSASTSTIQEDICLRGEATSVVAVGKVHARVHAPSRA